MRLNDHTHAWSGPLSALVNTSKADILDRLTKFLPDASDAQQRAWDREVDILQSEAVTVVRLHPVAGDDGTVLEYILPRQGGRRPDVVLLQNGRVVVVVEFKETGQLRRSDIDQVAAYARDLQLYHSACQEQQVTPILVLCGRGAAGREVDGVQVVQASQLGRCLVTLARASTGTRLDLPEFLKGSYEPLPSLVAAARLLFENLELPYIRRAHSAGVHAAVERILELAHAAKRDGSHKLVLLTGVPGAGKTLVGLQVAHSAALDEGWQFGKRQAPRGTGDFPVRQWSLGSGAPRRTSKAAHSSRTCTVTVREYGLEHPFRVPSERVIVFDEAQRAWDASKIHNFYSSRLPHVRDSLRHSEPDLLTSIASRLKGWGLVLCARGRRPGNPHRRGGRHDSVG